MSSTMILPCTRFAALSQRTDNGHGKVVDIDHGAVTVHIKRNNSMSIQINRRTVSVMAVCIMYRHRVCPTSVSYCNCTPFTLWYYLAFSTTR